MGFIHDGGEGGGGFPSGGSQPAGGFHGLEATLQVKGVGLVTKIMLPPFATLPEVIIWGSRVFIKAGEGAADATYNEAFAYIVPITQT